jgi:predicted O-linked N-acetylglucosamine transferase (SPINDLY family)
MSGGRPFDLLKEAARLHAEGKSALAEPLCRQALSALPDDRSARLLMGAIALAMDQPALAIVHFERIAALDPADASAPLSLGLANERLGNHDLARALYCRAIALAPDLVAAYLRLAQLAGVADAPTLHRLLALAWSLAPGDRSILIGLGNTVAYRVQIAMRECDWTTAEALGPELDHLNAVHIACGEQAPERPGISVSRRPDGAVNLAIARSWAKPFVQATELPRRRTTRCDGRLTIGYVSSDLGHHAVASLVQDVFARHDRRRFRVFLYSNAPALPPDQERRLTLCSDGLRAIHGLDAATAARIVAADGIDILIDLNGHTEGHRFDLFARRPAPVQASWLGFPGTTGAPFFDYVIADPVVAPLQEAAHFTEALALLPHSYQPNSREPVRSLDRALRPSHGLPEDAVVFCCFNQARKIDRDSFAVWMDILRAVPGSVLWLLATVPAAENNLRAAASGSGIDAARLIFAPKIGRTDHFARLGLADLGLDTFVYCGHTTTTDALWAGLPVLACRGRHFASRVSESLLRAAGLLDLVAPDLNQYRTMAIDLADTPKARAALRQRVADAREHSHQFNVGRFVADLERLFETMWDRHRAGKRPAAIAASS